MFTALFLASVLTSAAQIADGLASNRIEGTAFDLTGRVGCIIRNDSSSCFLALADGSGATVIHAYSADRTVSPGDRIRARGRFVMTAARFPDTVSSDISVLERGTPPTPVTATVSDLLSGKLDWRFARVSGAIRDVFPSETGANWVILILVADGDILCCSSPLNGASVTDFETLIGQTVSMDGIANPHDCSLRLYMGRIFQCPGLSSIRRIASSADPFDVPAADTLRALRPARIAAFGRVRTGGQVVAAWGGNRMMVRKPTGEPVLVTCAAGTMPKRGDFVEVSGFPLSDLFHITLTRALWRPAPPQTVREDKVIQLDADAVMTEQIGRDTPKINLQGRTVRLRGRVRNLPDEGILMNVLLVESGASIVPVDVSAAPNAIAGVAAKCSVEITGTCVLETEIWRPDRIFPQIRGFRIIVSDGNGIVVTAHPPWWTTGRLLGVIGALLAALVGVGIWNRALNRLAERRGRNLLREEIGHVKADLKTEERTRLAVELHDSLAQNLTGVSMEIETAQRCGTDNVPELMRHLGIADKALKSCRSDLRNTLWDLRNFSLEERDMDKAIRRTLLPHVRDVNLAVRFNVSRHRLSDRIAHEILRIIRELVLNGIRHGKATEIRIAGGIDGENLLFSVRDNGCGFDPEGCPGVTEGHFGLQGIRERLRGIAGGIAFDSAPGRGTKAVVKIRMQKPDTGEKP